MLKNAQMQVELCENPPAGAPEISRRERSRWAFFSILLYHFLENLRNVLDLYDLTILQG